MEIQTALEGGTWSLPASIIEINVLATHVLGAIGSRNSRKMIPFWEGYYERYDS